MFLDSNAEEEKHHISAYCMKIMLEAGADTSLEYYGDGIWESTFGWAVYSSSVVR